MRCQICSKNEATIHLTEISDGVRSEVHLCEHCAQEQGVAIKSQMPINELLSNLLAVQPSDEELSGSEEQQRQRCPHCGFTLEQFRKEPLVGCPYDYEVFEKVLLPVIEKAHDGRTIHCGKVPSKAPGDAKKQIELWENRCFITVESWAYKSQHESELFTAGWEEVATMNKLLIGEIEPQTTAQQKIVEGYQLTKRSLDGTAEQRALEAYLTETPFAP